jgi:choline dehydrogenase-like flavoprotein
MKTAIFPMGATARTNAKAVSREDNVYDAVIVGSGISGAIIANELSRQGKRVLILEAGPGGDRTLSGYQEYLSRYFATAYKDNQSPYPPNANAPMPRSTDARKITPGVPDTSGYMVQNGPFATDTTYTRVLGGTTLHWEAKTPRLLPTDFKMRSEFGRGEDWPIEYASMESYFEKAEQEMGVSANVEDQEYLDLKFRDGYVFPMHGMPLSYLDQMVAKGIEGTNVQLYGDSYQLEVRPFPQARNGIPNPKYDNGKGFVPVGAVNTTQVEIGGRCQGNNNCVPICPVQAKYNAVKTLAKALQSARVEILPQSVASKVHTDPNGRIMHIEYKTYKDPFSQEFTTGTARGKIFVLSTNAIENARLMLASGLQSRSGLIGRNLMDHAYLLSWALMPQDCGTMRGTNCTGGIVALRDGLFRRHQAAFSVDIHNDGWGWAVGSPLYDLRLVVDAQNKFGRTMRQDLVQRITRQLQLAFMIEVLPSESNRVSVDPSYKDGLGNMKPVISYTIPEYTMRGVAYARQFARLVFQRLGAADYTAYDPGDYGYLTYEGEGYIVRGGNHLAGTHIMGSNPATSVVDHYQRSWDHENLYLVGGGSMPSIGTANITLTIAALCYRTAEQMVKQLDKESVTYLNSLTGDEYVHA